MPYQEKVKIEIVLEEKIIGWYNKSTNHFLCRKCFSSEKNYEPVKDGKLKEKTVYVCGKCGREFEWIA